VSEQHLAGGVSSVSLADTSFTHIRCRISDNPVNYELFADDFESSGDAGNVASAPYPVGSWHHQGWAGWSTEGSATSVDVGEFNGVAGREMRIGWGYDEVVTLYSTPVPVHAGQTYTFRGRWEIGNVVDVPRGFIAGIAEFSADDGSLVQRLTPDSLVFGNTNAPTIGETGVFSISLSPAELVAAGVSAGNRIGVFFHHDDGGVLYDDSHPLKNDVYYIDNVELAMDIDGMFGQWQINYGVSGASNDPDRDGLDNLAEFGLGGNPTNPLSLGHPPTFGNSSNVFHYVYPRRLNSGLSYWLETSDNLLSNDWKTSGYVELPMVGKLDPDFEAVTNEIPSIGNQTFIRLKISE
jgi:hypothetical protein